MEVSTGPAFARGQVRKEDSDDTSTRTFGFMRAGTPGGDGRLRATAGSLSATTAYSHGLPLAGAVTAVARTSELYVDRGSLRAAYALTDVDGEPKVALDGLSVSMVLTFTDGGAPQTYACALPDGQNGLGECAHTLPTALFGSVARVARVSLSVRYGVSVAASTNAGEVTLMAALGHAGLSEAGMLAEMPQSPRFVNDEFEVLVWAHTGPVAFALKGWSCFVAYDTSVLSLQSSAFSDVYNTPTVKHDSSAGTFDVVATGLSPSYANGDVQGRSSLYLGTLRFRVIGGAGTTAMHVLRATVGSMVNQGTQRYVSDVPMAVTDHRAAQQVDGELVVEQLRVVGALAYLGGPLHSSSLVNTAALDGTQTTTSVRVVEVHNRAALGSLERTWRYVCNSRDPSIAATVESCTVSVGTAQTRGGRTIIDVSTAATGSLVAQLGIAVWYPQSVAVSLADTQLERLGCASSGFQETTASALASYGGDGLVLASQLDVSSLISFTSSNPSVASIVSRAVRGIRAGSALVDAQVASSALRPVSAEVVVSSSAEVAVESIRASVINSITWSETPPPVPWLPHSKVFWFTATAQVGQSFTSEGQ